jgi:hypothetical protein
MRRRRGGRGKKFVSGGSWNISDPVGELASRHAPPFRPPQFGSEASHTHANATKLT